MTLFLIYLCRFALLVPAANIAANLKRAAWAYLPFTIIPSLLAAWLIYLVNHPTRPFNPPLWLDITYDLAHQFEIVALIFFLQAVPPFSSLLARDLHR